MNKPYKLIAILVALIAAFSYGTLVGVHQKPPYKIIRSMYRFFSAKVVMPLSRSRTQPVLKTQDYWKSDVDSIITIRDEHDIAAKRDSLIAYIWKGAGFPTKDTFSSIEESIKDARYEGWKNLESIDRYTVAMDYGVNSIIYHFKPLKSNNALIIYHQGHMGDFYVGKENIKFFLEHDFSVLAFAMPLCGMNSKPVVEMKHFKKVRLINHDYFRFIDSPSFSSMKFFVEPIAIALNYIDEHYDYESINMVGISGGGWTTVFYSALDPRVKKSYPVTCSCQPLFLRSLIGDYEQTVPEIYRIANTLELNIMGAYGEDRRQMLIFNKYSPKGGLGTGNKSQVYKDELEDMLDELGKGSFAVYLDPSNTKHAIGKKALEAILRDISG